MNSVIASLVAIVGAWTALIGTAAVTCRLFRLSRGLASLLVLACYLCLAAAAIIVLGRDWQGLVGAVGMLIPCCVALALVILR